MAAAPLPLCHDRALTDATDPDATDPTGSDPTHTSPSGSDPTHTGPTGPDPTHTDPTGPDPAPTAVVTRPGSLVDLDRPGITVRHAMARRLERPKAMPTDILPAL